MFDFIAMSGPFGLLISLLILLNLLLVAWILLRLLGGTEPEMRPSKGLEGKINAVLFWGSVGAVLGVLGQVTGLYRALLAVSGASEVSLPIVFEGLAVSFTSTSMGLLLLLISALAWMGLRTLYRRLARDREMA